MNQFYLYSRDSKDKIRVFILMIPKTAEGYLIKRYSGILGGKMTEQPTLTVNKGKAKRTVEEQVQLQANSILSSQMDKGYKLPEAFCSDPSKHDFTKYEVVDKLFPSDKTDASGNKKPMLASDSNVLKGKIDKKTGRDKLELQLARAWQASYKLDGIRTLAKPSGKKMMFKSRSGKEFKGVAHHFENDKELIEFCNEYHCEIDGEFYIHGMPLKDINGICGLDNYVAERHDDIKFYIFDMALENVSASDRAKLLNTLEFSNPRVVVLKHTHLIGYEECMKFHDEAVELGYEGAMLRTNTGMYEFGKRSKELWKLKAFQDAEFTITGISEGLREEDMCFTMLTDDGVAFKAKMLGNRAEKQEYRKNIDKIIGKKGTVKFQYFTPDGKPFLPSFKNVRDDE